MKKKLSQSFEPYHKFSAPMRKVCGGVLEHRYLWKLGPGSLGLEFADQRLRLSAAPRSGTINFVARSTLVEMGKQENLFSWKVFIASLFVKLLTFPSNRR